MTPEELTAAYELSARPYLEAPGPVPLEVTQRVLQMRSWRYVLEMNSTCNLHCALCHAGNREGYAYTPGIMNQDLFERILDKIQSENPEAVVCAYVNSEPFLHPKLAENIASIKRRGLKCEIATNLNVMKNEQAVLEARPDLFTVSVSGFTQDVYEKSHRGGNIEVVKENLVKLAETNRKLAGPLNLGVSYHMYNDNLHEMSLMRKFAENLGYFFLKSWARAICIENTVQALRFLDKENTDKLEFDFPPAKESFIQSMERLRLHPRRCREVYEQFPVAPVCLISSVFTEIRHDGRVQLCAWTDDMRLTLGNYLDMTQEQIANARLDHPLCRECLKYRLNLYFHIVDVPKFAEG